MTRCGRLLDGRRILVALWLASALAGVTLAKDASALSPLHLVDSRVGVCLEARNLGARWNEIRESAWARRWKGSQLYTSWKSSDPARRLSEARGPIEELAGKPLESFLGELFGRHVVLALYQAGAADPHGMLITEAASDNSLTEALALWNRAEPQETDTRMHVGAEYFRRVRTAENGHPAETIYYARFGRILALSSHESLVQQAIELASKHAGGDGTNAASEGAPKAADEAVAVSASEEYVAAMRTMSDACFLRAYLQPQNWHWKKASAARSNAAESSAADDAAPDWVRGWQRCRSVAVGLRFDEGWIAEATARFPEDSSSERWTRFVEGSRAKPALAKRVPDDALAAWAGTVDLTDFAKLFQELIPARDRREFARFRQVSRGLLLGRDLLTDVIPALGPGQTGYIRARKPAGDERFPWEGVWALMLTPKSSAEPERQNPPSPLHAGLDNTLNTGLNVLAAMWNAEKPDGGAVVRSEAISADAKPAGTIRWVEGLGPVRPAFAALPDRIALGTSPSAVREFLAGDPPRPLVDAGWFRELASRHFRGGNQVLLVNVSGVRQSLDDNRERLVNHAVRRGAMNPDEAERRLRDVQDVLKLVDAAFLTAELRQHEVRLTVGGVLRGELPPR